MPHLVTGLLSGALAGAAGATALNVATFGDMAVRGRPSSSAPERLVTTVADDVGVAIPGDGDTRQHRVSGLAGVLGALTGTAVGAGAGVARAAGLRLPLALAAPLIGVGAMAASDVPLAVTGVSDPRSWTVKEWLADAIPHLVYGLVTAVALRALSSER